MRCLRNSRRKSFLQVKTTARVALLHSLAMVSEHVLEALATLGFPEYIDDVKAVHREYKEQASVGHSPLLCLDLS